jgi:hypothetical protein
MSRDEPHGGSGGYMQEHGGQGNYYGLADHGDHGNMASGTHLGKHYSSHFKVIPLSLFFFQLILCLMVQIFRNGWH